MSAALVYPSFVQLTKSLDPAETPSKQDDFGAALLQLESVANLADDWDSYGSRAPDSNAIFAARKLIVDAQRQSNLIPYFVGPVSGGGVQIEWHIQDGTIEIEVYPNKTFAVLVVRNKGSLKRTSFERTNISRQEVMYWLAIAAMA